MKYVLIAASLALPLMLTGCGSEPAAPTPPAAPVAKEVQPVETPSQVDAPSAEVAPAPKKAIAELTPTQGNTASGSLILLMTDKGVQITGTLSGVAAGGEHGFHVHEVGDCSAPDASSAGPHFNPEGHDHGHFGHGNHHAGDMPNLVADQDGQLKVDVVVPGLSLGDGAKNDALGRAVVLHAKADDYASQPAGDSGPRIACGVIK